MSPTHEARIRCVMRFQMVTITPHMDLANNILRIEIPLTEKGKGTITVETPLEPSEEQMNSYELVEDVTIWCLTTRLV